MEVVGRGIRVLREVAVVVEAAGTHKKSSRFGGESVTYGAAYRKFSADKPLRHPRLPEAARCLGCDICRLETGGKKEKSAFPAPENRSGLLERPSNDFLSLVGAVAMCCGARAKHMPGHSTRRNSWTEPRLGRLVSHFP